MNRIIGTGKMVGNVAIPNLYGLCSSQKYHGSVADHAM